MGNSDLKTNFITCEKCGKRLIERKTNGIFHFIFGKPGKENSFIPVEMYIQGNVKIKCLRRTCGHWQVLNFFPAVFQSSDKLESDCAIEVKHLTK
jgi:hypothetical protein